MGLPPYLVVRRALNARPADPRSGVDRRQMLPQQAGLFAAGADVRNVEGLARAHGEGKSRPKDLAAAFADGAVEENHCLTR